MGKVHFELSLERCCWQSQKIQLFSLKVVPPTVLNVSNTKSQISATISNPGNYTVECYYGLIHRAPHPCLLGAICLNWGSSGLCLSTQGTRVTPSSFPSGHMLTQPLYLTKLNFLLHCLNLHHQNRGQ